MIDMFFSQQVGSRLLSYKPMSPIDTKSQARRRRRSEAFLNFTTGGQIFSSGNGTSGGKLANAAAARYTRYNVLWIYHFKMENKD